MATEHALHRLVTQFMLDTCRYNKTTSIYAYMAFLHRCCLCNVFFPLFGDSEMFTSGSTAEFYLTPMLPCIGDIDLAVCFNSCIAIPSEQMPPTELEAYFQHSVIVFEIIDSHQPGYVYLRQSLYFLTKANNGSYVVKKRENIDNESGYLSQPYVVSLFQHDKNCHLDMNELYDISSCMFQRSYRQGVKDTIIETKNVCKVFSHGPALAVTAGKHVREFMTGYCHGVNLETIPDMDIVTCMHCKVWPPQAADWPTRSRIHGWPEQTTIRLVVNNGFDVVQVAHPSCRQDIWMNNHQWRLSFSRAEVTLLNSWTPVQQIVYHMVRFVMKHEILPKSDAENPEVPTLCNYHIKTLMLWEFEQTPQSWWSADFSVVKHCSRLLHQLLGCVAGKRCQHYFISNCNLFSYAGNATITTCNSLKTVSQESFLLKWFVENYVWKCTQHGSIEMSLFNDTAYMLQRAVDDVIDKKYSTEMWEHFNELNSFQLCLHFSLYFIFDMFALSLLNLYAKRVKQDLQNIDIRLYEYFTAVLSLRIACKISKLSLTEDLLELMWTLYDPCNDLHITCEPGRSLCMKKAIKLATLPGVCCSALEMLHDEMAKAYLHQSFTPGEESGDFIVVLHVLLATLYYKSGFYVKTIVHCKQVLNKRREQYASRSIGAEFLPRIDDSVDSVFGLMLLYQYLQENLTDMHNISQPVQKPAFTTDMLAHYLYSRCSAVPDTKSSKLSIYGQQLFQASRLLLGDVLLFKIMKPEPDKHIVGLPVVEMLKTDDTTGNSLSSMDTTLMVTLLELLALEKLSVVRQEMLRELYSEKFPVSNEFEVLHAYKCGLFEECFKICRSNVNLLLATGNKLHLQIYCTTFPELLYLLDGELVSLCGIIRLLQPICFLQILEFDGSRGICMLTLLLYLMIQCQRKMRCVLWDEAFEMIRVADQLMLSTDNDDYFFDRLVLKMTYRSLKLHADLRRAD